jgi:hypothetical protein
VDEVKAGVAHGSGRRGGICRSGRGDIGLRGVREPLPRGKKRLGVESQEAVGRGVFFGGGKAPNLRAVRGLGVGYKVGQIDSE